MGYKQSTTAITIGSTGVGVSGPCVVENFHLAAGSDTATAVIRDGGVNGPIRVKLSAAANTSDDIRGCFRFTQDVYVTFTGTGPVLTIAIPNPRANQLSPS